MIQEHLRSYNVILASRSPRRLYLLKELGLEFTVRTKEVDESFPEELSGKDIALHLALKKAEPFDDQLGEQDLVITADTIVWHDNKLLGKPRDREDAINMLGKLSGDRHEVFTGVCIKTNSKTTSFCDHTAVWFKPLSMDEIVYYVDQHQPFDKAGAYGAQEWLGYIGIERIEGSYFNVMGLPLKPLYEELMKVSG